jgi:hypothetical protein
VPRRPTAANATLDTTGTVLANSAGLVANWTLAARVYPSATGIQGTAIINTVHGGSGSIPYVLGISDAASQAVANQYFVGFWTGSTWRYIRSGVTYTPQRWTHVAGTWDSTTLRLFVDGKFVASTAPADDPAANNRATRIGHRWDGSTQFNGWIQEAAIWQAPLTDNEIVALSHRRSPLAVRPHRLAAYWPLDDYENGGGCRDHGPSGQHLTMSGVVAYGPSFADYTVADTWQQPLGVMISGDEFRTMEPDFIASTTVLYDQVIDRPVFIVPLELRWVSP